MNQEITSDAYARKARSDFNGFLNGVVKSGALSVEHVRVKTRQAVTEVFARKAVAAVNNLAPATRVVAKYIELDATPSGPVGLSEATALFMDSRPELSRFLGQTGSGAFSTSPLDMSSADLFAILNAYTHYEVSRRFLAAPSYGTGAASVVGVMTSVAERAPADVMAAADSVYAQSFADVHAISLCAAFDGNEAALTMLKEVLSTRDAGGDFGAFSLAPLSHDTRTAIEIIRSQLTNGTDFQSMFRDELWENSRWAAAEGMAAWMQSHGVGYRDASSMTSGLEAVGQVVAQASSQMKAGQANRSSGRPVA
jgi:hypothetical protein